MELQVEGTPYRAPIDNGSFIDPLYVISQNDLETLYLKSLLLTFLPLPPDLLALLQTAGLRNVWDLTQTSAARLMISCQAVDREVLIQISNALNMRGYRMIDSTLSEWDCVPIEQPGACLEEEQWFLDLTVRTVGDLIRFYRSRNIARQTMPQLDSFAWAELERCIAPFLENLAV